MWFLCLGGPTSVCDRLLRRLALWRCIDVSLIRTFASESHQNRRWLTVSAHVDAWLIPICSASVASPVSQISQTFGQKFDCIMLTFNRTFWSAAISNFIWPAGLSFFLFGLSWLPCTTDNCWAIYYKEKNKIMEGTGSKMRWHAGHIAGIPGILKDFTEHGKLRESSGNSVHHQEKVVRNKIFFVRRVKQRLTSNEQSCSFLLWSKCWGDLFTGVYE